MSDKLRIVLAQSEFPVGDIEKNLEKHIRLATHAREKLHADVIVFPELSLTGYPPEDLLYRRDFLEAAERALQTCRHAIHDIFCIIGHPQPTPRGLHNACSIFLNGEILGCYAKQRLPNEGVFDERRYFIPGTQPCVVPIRGIPTGIVICEDLWHQGPAIQAAEHGARLLLSPNASPFEVEKHERRQKVLSARARTTSLPILYTNLTGSQDECVYDGGSLAIDGSGNVCQCAGFFQENLLTVDLEVSKTSITMETKPFTPPAIPERIYAALVIGTRDYIRRNKLPGAMVGVSGGIDSALTLAVAVDALGPENVHAVILPSRYTSELSMEEALAVTKNLGVSHEIISIEPLVETTLSTLSQQIKDTRPNVVVQNIQARCRALILMSLSNQNGKIVLTTGNRSELAVGYTTLYGDMAGGFAVLKDIPKTLVYQLARYRNQQSAVIPERTLTRPPTAELAPGQKDSDSLPVYEVLDPILDRYINLEESAEAIIAAGFDAETVNHVIRMVHQSEYKRRQAAPGVRINHRAFGRDRRYPLTSGWMK